MSIEYHLYLLHFYYVNDYNIYFIMCMGGSMSAVMLLLWYLPMTMIIIILAVVLYSMYNLIIVKHYFRGFLYESCVSIKCICSCCCLPTPMTLASGGGGNPIFPLVVHQPTSPSTWPAVQSFRLGLSTNPVVTMWCVCWWSWRDDVYRVCECYVT